MIKKQLADIKAKINSLTAVEKDSLDSWSKRYSEFYMRKIKNEVYDRIFSKEKNGIAIISEFPTVDYSGGSRMVCRIELRSILSQKFPELSLF